MSDPDFQQLAALRRRCGLTYGQLAALSRVSPATIRRIFDIRRLPKRADARSRLLAFVKLNAQAATFGDVRAVAFDPWEGAA